MTQQRAVLVKFINEIVANSVRTGFSGSPNISSESLNENLSTRESEVLKFCMPKRSEYQS